MHEEIGQAVRGAFDPQTTGIMPDAEVVALHLLRHGEVEGLSERFVRGQLDVELSARGREHGQRLASWLRSSESPPDQVVTSDLRRCRELAELLVVDTDLPLVIEPRLREQHMGDWQGRTWAEVTAADPERVQAFWNDYCVTRPPGGESMNDLFERVGSYLDEVLRPAGDRRLHLVTHVGVIRTALCHQLGLPPSEALRFAPATASHTALLVSAAGAVVTAMGERPWSFGPGESGGARA